MESTELAAFLKKLPGSPDDMAVASWSKCLRRVSYHDAIDVYSDLKLQHEYVKPHHFVKECKARGLGRVQCQESAPLVNDSHYYLKCTVAPPVAPEWQDEIWPMCVPARGQSGVHEWCLQFVAGIQKINGGEWTYITSEKSLILPYYGPDARERAINNIKNGPITPGGEWLLANKKFDLTSALNLV